MVLSVVKPWKGWGTGRHGSHQKGYSKHGSLCREPLKLYGKHGSLCGETLERRW